MKFLFENCLIITELAQTHYPPKFDQYIMTRNFLAELNALHRSKES